MSGIADLSPSDWAAVLKAGQQDSEPERTDIPPGKDRANILQLRAEAGQSLYCPGDADQPPERVGQRVTFGRQGQLIDQGMEAPFYKEPEWDEFEPDPTPILPTDRIIQMEGWGATLGNPKVAPCPECSWQHEVCARCRHTTVGTCQRKGCGCKETICAWCGHCKQDQMHHVPGKEGVA